MNESQRYHYVKILAFKQRSEILWDLKAVVKLIRERKAVPCVGDLYFKERALLSEIHRRRHETVCP